MADIETPAIAGLPLGDFQMKEVRLETLEVYKVVGDQSTLLDYVEAHPPRVGADWAALYTQLDSPHALGTVPYRWGQGYSVARLLRVSAQDVRVMLVDAPWMPDGSIDGVAKASAVRAALDITDARPLMEVLGDRRLALACRETPGQWEVVFPVALARELLWRQEVAMELRPNEYGATSHCRETAVGSAADDGGDTWGPWRRFEDGEALREVEPPRWVQEALAEASSIA